VDLLDSLKVGTRSEIKRLITQGGVYFDNIRIDNFKASVEIKDEHILRIGKRQFIKILAQ
ncbi:MAG: tyrosine--tRNA ligase, partial [Fervidobacterium sp.]